MRSSLALALTLGLSGAAVAQQDFYVAGRPTPLSYVISSFTLGASAGEILIHIPKTHFRGIGDTGTNCEVVGFHGLIRNGNATDVQPLSWVIRQGDATGPADGPAFFTSGAFGIPAATFGFFNFGLGTPATIPCDEDLFVGVTDAGADITVGVMREADCMELGRPGSPNYAYSSTTPDTAASWLQPSRRTAELGFRVDCPTLNAGNQHFQVPACGLLPPTVLPDTPSWGGGGLFPDVAHPPPPGVGDGLAFKVADGTNNGGKAFLLMSAGLAAPFNVGGFGIKGNIWIAGPGFAQLTFGDDIVGGEAIIAPSWMGTFQLHRFAFSGTAWFQAITHGPAGIADNPRMSNAAASDL